MNQSNWKRVFLCRHLFLILTKCLSVSVHVASKNKKRKNDAIICYERLSSITFEKTMTKNIETKPVFFLKNTAVFWKKKSQRLKKNLHTFLRKTPWKLYDPFITFRLQMWRMNYMHSSKSFFQCVCETSLKTVLGCPFGGTCLQPVIL